MPRPGFAFSTRLKVRYAEIDGQKVVFNSRYLEYADVAVTEFYEWTGIAEALGAVWHDTEFHVRRAELDYLAPFALNDEIDIYLRIDRLGTSSITKRIEMVNPTTGVLHHAIDMVSVNVHLPTGRPVPLPPEVRAFFEALPSG